MLKNVVVKIVQVAAGAFVGVVMNDTVNKYVVEPSQKKINSKMGRPNKVSFFFAKFTTRIMRGDRDGLSLFFFLFNNERRKQNGALDY